MPILDALRRIFRRHSASALDLDAPTPVVLGAVVAEPRAVEVAQGEQRVQSLEGERYGDVAPNGVAFDKQTGRYVALPAVHPARVAVQKNPHTATISGDSFEELMESVAEQIGGKYMHANIAGITFPNEDGSSRQDAAATLKTNDQLFFASDFENAHDENAIRLMKASGECVGFVPVWLNEDVAESIRNGYSPICLVKSVGLKDGNHGVAVGIAWKPV